MRPISRILAATDFSAASGVALQRAGVLAAQHSAELHVVHARPDWNLFSNRMRVAQDHYEGISRDAERLMRETVQQLSAGYSIRVAGDVHRGKASQVIRRTTDAFQPHLVVMGARGEHGPQAFAGGLGATTLKVMAQVDLPLLLVRTPATGPYQTSVAALGLETDRALRVLEWTETLTAGDCHVVRVYEVPYLERLKLLGVSDETIAACARDAQAAARSAFNLAASDNHDSSRLHHHLVQGVAVPTILAEVSRYGGQVLVIGRHEQRSLTAQPADLGCVGLQIAYRCPVDVLIVP